MPFFQWGSEHDVGVPVLNEQHQRLVALVNQLYESAGAGLGDRELAEVLDELVAYAHVHFTAEEHLLAQSAYPELTAHRAEHEAFFHRVLALRADAGAGKLLVSMDLMKFLREWLKDHLLSSDKRYAPHLGSRGAK